MPTEHEVSRLQEVYKGYSANSAKQAQWDRANPGNIAILAERRRETFGLLHRQGFFPLENTRILEIGCGSGHVLADFFPWGANPENLHGVDLLPDRIQEAKAQYPEFHFECANAEMLSFTDAIFDVVLLFTVFSSILDRGMQERVAAEAQRVLKPTGGVLWYDFRFNNPANPNVRGMTKRDMHRLFPDFHFSICSLTLLPPLARKLGSKTPTLYPLLGSLPFLRTHYLALGRRKNG